MVLLRSTGLHSPPLLGTTAVPGLVAPITNGFAGVVPFPGGHPALETVYANGLVPYPGNWSGPLGPMGGGRVGRVSLGQAGVPMPWSLGTRASVSSTDMSCGQRERDYSRVVKTQELYIQTYLGSNFSSVVLGGLCESLGLSFLTWEMGLMPSSHEVALTKLAY